MKTPIEPSEIRKGDTVERHWLGTVTTLTLSRIGKSLAYTPEGYCMGLSTEDGETFYLLDRPAPPVSLPSEPTLGWLTFSGRRTLGRFRAGELDESTFGRPEDVPLAIEVSERGKKVNAMFRVTAFIPATAVPTKALDELRDVWRGAEDGFEDVDASDVARFLAAVDKAGEQS